MIVKNEADNLPRCLASVQGVVDEMVVMDTGSSDQTVAIAEAWGAHVPTFPWKNDFASARNAALAEVRSDWVLVLDADEVLVSGMIPQLKQAIQEPTTLVINLLREEVGAKQSPFSRVSRLFRNHPEIRWNRPYHALIDDSVLAIQAQEPHWQICNLDQVALEHYGYEPTVISAQAKHEKARRAMEQFLGDHPHDAYVCSKLGALYIEMGNVDTGVGLLQRGLQENDLDPGTRYELNYHLANAYQAQAQLQHAERYFQAAIQVELADILKIGACNNLANLYQGQGALTAAQRLYEQVIRICPDFAIAHYNLGLTLKALGDLPGAIQSYQQALTLNPHHAEAHQNLAVVLLKQGQFAASITAFQAAIHLHQQQNNSEEAQRLQQGLLEMGIPSP